MNLKRYFLCFVLYSFIGWLYESVYYTLRHKKPVNTGFLTGCLCPIYGLGAMLDIMLLGDIENTWKLFAAGMLLTCSLEYAVSWILEEIFGTRWWDYSTWPFNIHGRVCLLGGLAFGTMSVLLVKFIHPAAVRYISFLSVRTVNLVCMLSAAAILSDLIVTVRDREKFDKKLWFVDTHPGMAGDGFVTRHTRAVIQYIRDYINNR